MAKQTTPKQPAILGENETLNGSNTLPALIEITADKSVQLGEVVNAAFLVSGLTVEAWNALDEAERDGLLNGAIEGFKVAEEQKKAAAAAAAAAESLQPRSLLQLQAASSASTSRPPLRRPNAARAPGRKSAIAARPTALVNTCRPISTRRPSTSSTISTRSEEYPEGGLVRPARPSAPIDPEGQRSG